MSKKPRFRTLFHSQHAETFTIIILPYFSMTLGKMESKNVSLLISEMFRLFLNTLTADDKYSLGNSENLLQPTQIQLSKKQKTFCQFFSPFVKSTLNLEYFFQKDERKTWLDKCLKSPVSENPSRVNIVMGPKYI